MADGTELTQAQLRSSITKILNNGDLSQLTSKIVRTELEDNFGVSLRARRKEVDMLIMETINKQQQSTTEAEEEDSGLDEDSEEEIKKGVRRGMALPTQQQQEQKPRSSAVSVDNGKVDDDSDDDSDVNIHNDEQLARKLQEDERGSRRRSRQVKKERKPKKSHKKKEPGQAKEGSVLRQFTPMVLSPELAEVVGKERMCRTEVVKTIWRIVKERKLEDPKNKRYCNCDEQLQKVFGRKKILTFGMMKYLKNHMTAPEPLA